MFAAIVLLTFPFWGATLFYVFVWVVTGGDPKGAARRAQAKKLENEAHKEAGRRAVDEGYRKDG